MIKGTLLYTGKVLFELIKMMVPMRRMRERVVTGHLQGADS